MPIGNLRGGGLAENARYVTSGSSKGLWFDAHDDLETADTSGGSLAPATIATTGFHWVRVPEGATRVLVRGAITAGATPSTDPTVCILGAYGTPASDGSFHATPGNANHAHFMRLDNVDANAAGVTIDLEAAANVISDGAWDYSNPTTLDGYDCRGAWYVGVFVLTVAGAFTGTAKAQVMFLN